MKTGLATGLITPPFSSAGMDRYAPSSKSDATVSDLCAQTVCFLWFETLPTLHEAATTNYPHHTRIPDIDSTAKPEFVKWTHDVLSTTQVSINVVILAMLFIYRLKIANPTVKGKAGSEYRLMTVALMLGNKFLDDNTYTNKTWADVTSISVKEIHLMEVEFLSNMRYQLMVTVEEWHQWLSKINLFVRYQQKQRTMSYQLSSPLGLPSPPTMCDLNGYTPTYAGYRYQGPLLNPMQTESRGRKRSLGDIADAYGMLPPYKKILSQPTTPQRSTHTTVRPRAIDGPSHDTSPSRRNNLQLSMMRTMPSVIKTLSNLPAYLPSTSQCQPSTHNSGLSPSRLQGRFHSGGSSPTTSSTSYISAHSYGNGLGYSPTSMAMQNRNSPYAPVQPVHRLEGKYQPPLHALQTLPAPKESLWYSQLAAGDSQPVYNGRVPLSTHNSPYQYTYQR